ncbi:GumC family protein [Lutispora sp.]|uniref:GumC family protein n=1 Tax=Lutispora sp. TaxID=2828727 RepID=UPI00356AA80E
MEDISLRELIEILLRGKKIITLITVIAILVSGIINYMVLEPEYEGKVVLMASGINSRQQTVPQAIGVEAVLNTLSQYQYSQMSIETYKEQINNPQVLQQTIDELKLSEYGITRRSLKGRVSLATIKDTNLITITVNYSDNKLAADIANTIAKKFTDFVSEKSKEQAAKSSNYIKQQMDVEKENLDKVLLEYKDYLSQPRGLNELQKELDSKLTLITQYKTDLLNSNIEEQKTKASLAAAEKQLQSTPQKIKVTRSLLDEPFMSQAMKDTSGNDSKDSFGVVVEAEEVNDAYTQLKILVGNLDVELAKIIAQKNNLQKEISILQKELETLQGDLAVRQHEDMIMQEKVKFSQETYNAFLEKYEETRIASSSAIGESTIIIVSPAVEPMSPIAPNKRMNMAIAVVLGIMLGVFIAYFKEYWQASSPKNLSM